MENSLKEFNLMQLDDIDGGLTEFSICRTRENLKRPVFIIVFEKGGQEQLKGTIKKIVDYLAVWINLPLKKTIIDCCNEFNQRDIRTDRMYVFNASDIKNIIKDESYLLSIDTNETVTSSILNYLIRECGPMIILANKTSDIPVQLRSSSDAVFIYGRGNVKNILDVSVLVTLEDTFEYKIDNILAIDGMCCQNKLSIFKNIFC